MVRYSGMAIDFGTKAKLSHSDINEISAFEQMLIRFGEIIKLFNYE